MQQFSANYVPGRGVAHQLDPEKAVVSSPAPVFAKDPSPFPGHLKQS